MPKDFASTYISNNFFCLNIFLALMERFEVVKRIGDGSYGNCRYARRRSSNVKITHFENVVLKELSKDREGNESVFKSKNFISI